MGIPTLLCSSGFSVWGRGLLTEEMKLEAVVVTEAAAEEEESRKAFVKTVHITAFNTNTRPTQLRRSNTGSCRTKPEISVYFYPPHIQPHQFMVTLEPNLMVWAFKTELQLVLHRHECIKSQKEKETRKQLWTDCESAMSCCRPSLTLQAEKCWDNVQQLPCQKPTCRKLSSSQCGATCNAHKCPLLIT